MCNIRCSSVGLRPQYHHHHTTTVLRPFFRDYPGEPVPVEKLLDFMVQGNINRGRHTDHLAGHHSIRTNQCPPQPCPHFFSQARCPSCRPTNSIALKAHAPVDVFSLSFDLNVFYVVLSLFDTYFIWSFYQPENFWTLWCKGILTEVDIPTVRLGATPSGLTSAHLHHPLIFYRPDALLPRSQQCRSTEGNTWVIFLLFCTFCGYFLWLLFRVTATYKLSYCYYAMTIRCGMKCIINAKSWQVISTICSTEPQ